jgi:hypothetical protein
MGRHHKSVVRGCGLVCFVRFVKRSYRNRASVSQFCSETSRFVSDQKPTLRLRRTYPDRLKLQVPRTSAGAKSETEDRNVVLLAVGLGYGGNLFGRLGTDLAGAVEAEELTERRPGFDDAVREDGEAVARSKTQYAFGPSHWSGIREQSRSNPRGMKVNKNQPKAKCFLLTFLLIELFRHYGRIFDRPSH